MRERVVENEYEKWNRPGPARPGPATRLPALKTADFVSPDLGAFGPDSAIVNAGRPPPHPLWDDSSREASAKI